MKNIGVFGLIVAIVFLCGFAQAESMFPTGIDLTNPDGSDSVNNASITLYDEVTNGSANDVIEKIHKANRETSSGPIALYINSPGGSVLAGMRILDAMAASKRPITTVCVSMCASMAGVIFVHGAHKIALPSALILFHDGQSGVQNSSDKVYSEIDLFKKIDARLENDLAAITGLSVEDIHTREASDWWLLADEAKKLHIVDEVINLADFPTS